MNKLRVNNDKLKKEINLLGFKQVYNYYGMIEQTGSVFLECEKDIYIVQFFQIFLLEILN